MGIILGLEQFIALFKNITIADGATVILAGVFCFLIYKRIKSYFIYKYESEKEKDEKINFVLEEVNKYPEYREKSRQIQKEFREEINDLRNAQEVLSTTQQEICVSLKDMKEKNERRERNKLRDKLLQSYRYYNSKERNPDQSWTKMESEAFWELFRDYEDMGGDGYMHTVVQPAMNLLKIIEN